MQGSNGWLYFRFKITLDHKNQKGIGNYFMYDPCNGIKCDEEDGTSVSLYSLTNFDASLI